VASLKILIAVHHLPPNYTGGAEWRAYRTAYELQARGHQVRLVCVEKIDQPVSGYLEWKDELFNGLNVRRLFYDLESAKDPFQMNYDNQWIGQHIEGILQEDRPDIFHLIGGYLMSGSVLRASKRHGIPTVVSLTDFWYLCPRFTFWQSNGELSSLPIDPFRCARCLGEESRRWSIPGKIFPKGMDFIWRLRKNSALQLEERFQFLIQTLKNVDSIISPSEFLRTVYIQAGIDPHRIHYSRQGRYPVIDAYKDPKPIKNGRHLRIGYIGSILPHKGVHVLVEVVRMIPEKSIRLMLFGDQTISSDYTNKITTLIGSDDRIKLKGTFPRENLGEVFSELDVLVVPSVWYENSPNTILEAFAHKTPVIATNLGGMVELVHHDENGLLFETNNAHGLKEQIQRLLDEPQLLEQLRSGIQPVKSVEDEIDELVEIYQSVSVNAYE
jgi:glycosyltransferase involved in cell wall biosynthesis